VFSQFLYGFFFPIKPVKEVYQLHYTFFRGDLQDNLINFGFWTVFKKLTMDNTKDFVPFALFGISFSPVKILFIGDIVGEPGRKAVKALVPKLREEHALDFVIANGENSAGGSGITPKTAEEIFSAGVDVITSGDHLWDQKEVMALLADEKRFLRPLNYPSGVPGRGCGVFESKRGAVGVMNFQGRTFMQPPVENPFLLAMEEVKKLRERTKIIFVDFHAEATSEKIAFARMLDGQVSAVAGTHTHVQTADEQIFPGGTAYLSDAGFTGPHESVLGREIEPVIRRFLTSMPQRFEVAKGRVLLQGVWFELDESSGKALKLGRISEAL
jgi:metallophosphoesterase (TIGR00282 family)